jgi:hypothetical protein
MLQMKTILFVLLSISTLTAQAQTQSKARVFGEVGLGFGQTLFFGDSKERLAQTFGGSFKPGTGFNIMTAFYVAPENWKGLGIGTRVKGTFGTSVKGESDADSYIFNFYSVQLSAKYYPFSKTFNKGLYTRLSAGFGQFTAKRLNESTNYYLHQYAIGSTLGLSAGYTIPLKRSAISFEVEFESSSRNGTVNTLGSQTFQTGQLGFNTTLTF